MDDLIGELSASIEKAAEDSGSPTQAAQASAEANVSKLVEDLKTDNKGVGLEQKKADENKLLEDMKNAFSDENYKQFMDKMISSDTATKSSPSDPTKAPTEKEFVQNLETCMKQLKEEEGDAIGGDFFANFMKSFEGAMDNDESFSNGMDYLMSGMLSKNVLSDSLHQIVEQLEPYVESNVSVPADQERYKNQLRVYKEILAIYDASGSELTPEQHEAVNTKLQNLQEFGSPPEHIMDKLKGSEEPVGEEDGFEDFVKNMGLSQGLGDQEQEMIKQLSANPAELNEIMQQMASEIKGKEEPCKQQ